LRTIKIENKPSECNPNTIFLEMSIKAAAKNIDIAPCMKSKWWQLRYLLGETPY